MIAAAILDRLRAIVGAGGWSTDAAELAPYLVEGRGLYQGRTPLLLKPATTAEVAALVAICAETGTPIVPQGGNTGLVGGGVPFESGNEVLLSLSRMNKVRGVDPLNNAITVEAGCTLAAVQGAAGQADRLFPLRIASEGSCQIGGNLSTNAGGNAVLRYGMMRELVLGLEVVLPDGRVIDGLRALRKDNTGYDLKQWFIGAEGTLGIITAATLKLFSRPRDRQTAFVAVPDVAAAVSLLGVAQAVSGGQVEAFELVARTGLEFVLRYTPGASDPLAVKHDWYALIEIAGGDAPDALRPVMERLVEAALVDGLALDGVIAGSAAQAQALWRLRESMSDAQKPEGGSIKHDISVPRSSMATFITRATAEVLARMPDARPVVFGHIGDGNVHFNISQPLGGDKAVFLGRWHEISELVHGVAHELHGSISAEHGIGRLKRDELPLYKSAVELDLMRGLKQMLDPGNIMNPGKLL